MAVGAVGSSGGSAGSSAALSAEELEQRAQEAVDAYCALATELHNGTCRGWCVTLHRDLDRFSFKTSNLMKSQQCHP